MKRSLVFASLVALTGPTYVGAACSSSPPSAGSADSGNSGAEGSVVADVARDSSDAHVDEGADSIAVDGDGRDVSVVDVLDARAGETSADVVVEAAPWVDPYGGASGCPDGGFMSRGDCQLNMPVGGGVSTVAGNYCRNSATTSYLWWASNGINPDVHINFSPPIVRGTIGTQSGVSVSILYQPTSGTWITWTTPPGACSATLTSNVCSFDQGSTYHYVSGRGSCSEPATPQPDAAAPVTIGDFTFANVIYP